MELVIVRRECRVWTADIRNRQEAGRIRYSRSVPDCLLPQNAGLESLEASGEVDPVLGFAEVEPERALGYGDDRRSLHALEVVDFVEPPEPFDFGDERGGVREEWNGIAIVGAERRNFVRNEARRIRFRSEFIWRNFASEAEFGGERPV